MLDLLDGEAGLASECLLAFSSRTLVVKVRFCAAAGNTRPPQPRVCPAPRRRNHNHKDHTHTTAVSSILCTLFSAHTPAAATAAHKRLSLPPLSPAH